MLREEGKWWDLEGSRMDWDGNEYGDGDSHGNGDFDGDGAGTSDCNSEGVFDGVADGD